MLERKQSGCVRAVWVAGLILVTASAGGAEPNQRRQPWRKLPGPAKIATEDTSEWIDPPASAFQRDGFFTRLAIGTGVFSAYTGSPGDARTLLGAPVSIEAYFGTTLSRHLSLGAGYARDAIGLLSAHDEQVDGDEPRLADTSFFLEHLSAFLAAYPSRESPYYGFATLGFGTLNVRKDSDNFELPLILWFSHLDGYDPSGFILSLGGGYDTWLNPRWALGVSGRVLAAFLTSHEIAVERAVTVVMPSVLVSLSYY